VSIESAVLIPLFLAAVLLVLQGSLWFYASTVAQAAAQDGARAATRVDTDEDGTRTARDIIAQRSIGQNWQVSSQAGAQTVTIVVTGEANTILPGWTVAVRESATLPWEEPR
jgi:Flp pilus assembly protein TadG